MNVAENAAPERAVQEEAASERRYLPFKAAERDAATSQANEIRFAIAKDNCE